jgi:hypothetical protein
MQAKVLVKNIVLAGRFNPSFFDKYFFIKNNIANESEILGNSSFIAIGAIQLITNEFNILITVNQIVITDSIPNKNQDRINHIIRSIIECGNLYSITAIGINFHWLLTDNSKSFKQLSKDLFYRDDIGVLSNYFNTDDSMYGLYASKVVKDSRLKLDIKPSNLQQINVQSLDISGMLFTFNFHFDIKNKINTEEVLNYINDYVFYKEESEKLLSIYL